MLVLVVLLGLLVLFCNLPFDSADLGFLFCRLLLPVRLYLAALSSRMAFKRAASSKVKRAGWPELWSSGIMRSRGAMENSRAGALGRLLY